MKTKITLLNLCQQALKFDADLVIFLKKHPKEEALFSKLRRSVNAVASHTQHAVSLTDVETTEISNEERDRQVRSNIDNALKAAKTVESELSILLSRKIVTRKETYSLTYKLENIMGGLKTAGEASCESRKQNPQDLSKERE